MPERFLVCVKSTEVRIHWSSPLASKYLVLKSVSTADKWEGKQLQSLLKVFQCHNQRNVAKKCWFDYQYSGQDESVCKCCSAAEFMWISVQVKTTRYSHLWHLYQAKHVLSICILAIKISGRCKDDIMMEVKAWLNLIYGITPLLSDLAGKYLPPFLC